MIISTDTEKITAKIQHPFMIKNIQETRNRTEFPNMIKGICKTLYSGTKD